MEKEVASRIGEGKLGVRAMWIKARKRILSFNSGEKSNPGKKEEADMLRREIVARRRELSITLTRVKELIEEELANNSQEG